MIKNMNGSNERVLLVESDPEISDLISRQTLLPMGYQVETVGASSLAIQEAIRYAPDVIIINLDLPGLSGKDLLVALASQGVDAPAIVIAKKEMEGDVLQAFRLGAVDFLGWPLREAEVISAVERVLKQVRARREREMLARQLKQTNQELQRRVRELTTIFAIGKAVISAPDVQSLFEKIIEGAVFVTEADSGWLLVRDERSKVFILKAYRNIPPIVAAKLNQPWDDGLSSLVALSGETLAIHGNPLKRFKVAKVGQSALVTPVKTKREVVGLLVVVRKEAHPFGASQQTLLEAVADYASIALINVRLFQALEERVNMLQQTSGGDASEASTKPYSITEQYAQLPDSLAAIREEISQILASDTGQFTPLQTHSLQAIQQKIIFILELIENLPAKSPQIKTEKVGE